MPPRGGFMGGGVVSAALSSGGALPAAKPVHAATEADVAREVASVAAGLAHGKEWGERVAALLRLEGLVLGGAAGGALAAALADGAVRLRSAVAAQMVDRRSAVSRQACHAVAVLARALGPRFETAAVDVMPSLFKSQAMAITVVTEAAHECALAVVAACPSGRQLPFLTDVLRHDKNKALRQAAAAYVVAALDGWDPEVWRPHLTRVEAAVAAAVEDAAPETRAAGRAMFAAFDRGAPDAAAGLFRRLPPRVQQQLTAAAQRGAGPGSLMGQLSDASRLSGVSVPPSPAGSRPTTPLAARPPTPAARPHAEAPSPRPPAPPAAAPPPAPWEEEPAPPPPPPPVAEPQQQPQRQLSGALSEAYAARKAMAGAAVRVPAAAAPPPRAAALDAAPGPPPVADWERPAAPAAPPPVADWERPPPTVPLPQLVADFSRRRLTWDKKVELLAAMHASLRARGAAAPPPLAEKLVAILLDGVADAHLKVNLSALVALDSALNGPAARDFEPHLRAVLPPLFAKAAADSKEQVRHAIFVALRALPAHHPPDAVVGALARSVRNARSTRAKCAVLDFFTACLTSGDAAGGALGCCHGPALQHILAAALELATDKSADVRACALRAIEAERHADAAAARCGSAPGSSASGVARSGSSVATEDLGVIDMTRLDLGGGGGGGGGTPPAAARPPADAAAATPPAAAAPALAPAGSAGDAAGARESPGSAEDLTAVRLRRFMEQVAAGPSAPALQGIARLLRTLPEDRVCAQVNRLLGAVFASLESPAAAPEVREAALALVAELAGAAPRGVLAAPAPALLPHLLRCMGDPDPEVGLAAEEALHALAGAVDAASLLSLLAQRLPVAASHAPFEGTDCLTLHSALRGLAWVAARLPPPDLGAALYTLTPALVACYSAPRVEIRKASVDCLVAAWLVVGDAGMAPHAAALPPAQAKLFALYKDKAAPRRA